jgi:tRNA modification GTPase
MLQNIHAWQDTIVALATPNGVGAIGVIRLSGNNAIDIVNKIFPKKNLAAQFSHTLHVGNLVYEDNIIDEVVVALYKGPKSYTGEDIVEISCHGSNYIIQKIIETCVQLGARVATPGEFTQRSFLNGKQDLAQAEAVADLIASESKAQQQLAFKQMKGGFSKALKIN